MCLLEWRLGRKNLFDILPALKDLSLPTSFSYI